MHECAIDSLVRTGLLLIHVDLQREFGGKLRTVAWGYCCSRCLALVHDERILKSGGAGKKLPHIVYFEGRDSC